ncbi:hypothetical protein M5U04_20645 [Xenorhabdus sp. XENO-1]|uniref:hypothetical protein n=1 Tax=Xenorhabdus bovienii TaxID=40576 RepID=UPI0020CA36FE|nr:hypothetical protein [Xenorhabdus bovienii]MCP9270416.1 hypothetical protein [Xenorhabdus bovienii subsp. africana]
MNNKLQTAVEIAEEIETQLVPLMVEIDSENPTDAYLMCRGIYRQMKGLAEKLREVAGGGNNHESSNNESSHDKLEGVASEIESLRTYISLLIDTDKSLSGAQLLSIALIVVFEIGKQIARIRGVEYS